MVVDELSSLARFLNAQTVKCPATAMLPKRDADGKSNGAVLPAQVSAIEPDVNMQLVGPDRPIAVDVAVVYGEQSIAVKAVSAAKAKGWEAMEEAIAAHGIVRRNEKEKRHYVDAKTGVSATEVCNQNGYAFEPFIVETHGYLGDGAMNVIRQMAMHAGNVMQYDHAATLQYLMRRIAIALQRANALLDATYLTRVPLSAVRPEHRKPINGRLNHRSGSSGSFRNDGGLDLIGDRSGGALSADA